MQPNRKKIVRVSMINRERAPEDTPQGTRPRSEIDIRHRSLADAMEHARADRNDASTAKVGAESGTGATPETRGVYRIGGIGLRRPSASMGG
jgi:hypothetical protein